MARLVVNPDTAAAWEIPLGLGVTALGRGEDNHFRIAHDSVSTVHCEITLDGVVARIRDLGSRNGTFINGQLVEESALQNRQIIRLGDVVMRYEADDASIPAEPPIPPPMPGSVPVTTTAAHCKVHPRSVARFLCPKCGSSFCELCVSSRREQGRVGKFCRVCSVECTPLSPALSRVANAEISFPAALRSAFSYPLKGDGIILLIAGGIFLMLIDAARFLARFAFLYGLVALVLLTVFGTGYLVSYLRRIVTSSAGGENKMPDWPDFTDFGTDILSPFLQFIGTVIFSFGPAIVLTVAAPADTSWLGWVTFACILLGCVYFPMAFLAVAMFDSVMAVNPLLIVPSILRIPAAYVMTMALFVAVLLVRWLGFKFLPAILPIPLVPWIISSFFGLYLLVVEVRILGLLYWFKKDELGWFGR